VFSNEPLSIGDFECGKLATVYMIDTTSGTPTITLTATYDGKGIPGDTQKQTVTLGLLGTWVNTCYLASGDTDFSSSTATFTSGLTFTEARLKYSDSACATSSHARYDSAGTFVPGELVGGVSRRYTYNVSTLTVTATSPAEVTSRNSASTCNSSDWVLNTARNCLTSGTISYYGA
jgi:hypothetical protein